MLRVERDQAINSQEITGECGYLDLWSQVGDDAAWLPVAQNTMLITSDFRAADGVAVFCTLAGIPGPNNHELPMSKVPEGWYVVCNLSDQSTDPFGKT